MLKRYIKDQSGQFAIMFAIAATMLLALTGIVIDGSSMQSTKSRNQSLADAAVLAAAISGEDDLSKLKKIAEKSVESMTGGNKDYEVEVIILADNTLKVIVTKPYKAMIYSGFGEPIDIKAAAEAPPKGQNKLNIALVLDVTDSMSGPKLSTLKVAANDLVEVFESSDPAEVPPVQFSVIPFARYIRLPVSMAVEPWLEVEPPNYTCWDKLDLAASQAAGVCVVSSEEGEDYSCTNPVYYEHCEVITWSGCVTSRVTPWHTKPEVGPERIPGFAGGGGCDTEILPLTDDLSDVKNKIANLNTGDETYIPSGLMWGWRSLKPEAPLTEANTADYSERSHVMILMTDGENSRSYGGDKGNGFKGVFHWEQNMVDANNLTAGACADIKFDGIEIYTVAFEVSDATTLNMLRTCASHPNKFFDASNAALLKSAFETIGDELAQVRLSR